MVNLQFRDAAKNHVPGMDPAALAAAQQANKLKSAKRNEKRKEKRATEKAAGGAAPDRRSASAADATAARMQQLNLGTSGRGNSSGAAPAAPASPAAAADDPTATDRQIRALKKKVSAWQSVATSMCNRTYQQVAVPVLISFES